MSRSDLIALLERAPMSATGVALFFDEPIGRVTDKLVTLEANGRLTYRDGKWHVVREVTS